MVQASIIALKNAIAFSAIAGSFLQRAVGTGSTFLPLMEQTAIPFVGAVFFPAYATIFSQNSQNEHS